MPLPPEPGPVAQAVGILVLCAMAAAALLALTKLVLACWPLVPLLLTMFVCSWIHGHPTPTDRTPRANATICHFARAFERRAVDTWILRATYEHLSQSHGIALDRDRLGRERDREPVQLGLPSDRVVRLLEDLSQIQRAAAQADPSRVHAGDVQEIVHEVREVVGLSADDLHRALSLLVGQGGAVVPPQLDGGADRPEGVAELVAQRREEIVLALELGPEIFDLGLELGELTLQLFGAHARTIAASVEIGAPARAAHRSVPP